METIRHVALGCCVISTVAGMIRVFWPDNGFAPVINAVLALYIITAALQMIRGTDWKMLSTEMYRLAVTEQTPSDSYEAYGKQLGMESSVEAVRTILAQAGIDAAVQLQGDTCRITLLHAGDRTRAESILAASCGTLPYEIVVGGEAP